MLQVRQKVYRGVPGYLVCGTPAGKYWPVSIFCGTREEAVRIRDLIKAGRPWEFDRGGA